MPILQPVLFNESINFPTQNMRPLTERQDNQPGPEVMKLLSCTA